METTSQIAATEGEDEFDAITHQQKLPAELQDAFSDFLNVVRKFGPLIPATEVRKLFHVSMMTEHRWRAAGVLQAPVIIRRRCYYGRSGLLSTYAGMLQGDFADTKSDEGVA